MVSDLGLDSDEGIPGSSLENIPGTIFSSWMVT